MKPTTQIQKPSHRIQNRQNNMKHIALISVKLKYIHTHKQNINIHTGQTDSKAKSTQQIKWVVKTKRFIEKNPKKKKWSNLNQADP